MVHTDRATVLIGVYYSCAQAEKAARALQRSGFREDQLRVTLCDADLVNQSIPRTGRWTSIAAAGLGGVGGGLLLGAFPILGSFWASVGIGVLAGAVGGVWGAWIRACHRSKGSHAPGKALHLSRGVVTVRPQQRYREAADILQYFAGCDGHPAALPR